MKCFQLKALCFCILLSTTAFSQVNEKRQLAAQRINSTIKIDGVLDEAVWKDAPVADKFVSLRPTPFLQESNDNATQVYFLYDNEGIYVGGYLHEKNKDSIASELTGRDGFGANDFLGVVFDTYYDKLNGFEYFVTPLGEQYDAKVSPSGGEDFSWNAVWESKSKLQADGWSFEMFIPYAAIRFGKKSVQDWGLNIVRRRQKSGQQLFWQPIDPNVNGFLTQEGLFTGLQNIKPPLRLQLSPYMSTYLNHDGTDASKGKKRTTATINGGMDVKYGLNQAFTLDMTLIPDFGQVQSDNRVLNLSPFEVRFNENRAFFTEGVELFNKGNLFYSRRIGLEPRFDKYDPRSGNDELIEYPGQAKIINATKISGRTQKGLGIGVLNAITQKQFATFRDPTTQEEYKTENMPLTNYNILVFDQTLKNNSSVSLVNTNVWRSGNDYDANVTSALFDFNNKKNVWNIGGNVSFSNIIEPGKTTTGYAHSIYMGKTSGRFTFNIWQDLFNDKYDKSDFGFFTNNNTMDQGFWAGYAWTKPKGWYNQMRMNINGWYSRLVKPIDIYRRKELMYQGAGINFNFNAQTKKLWWFGVNVNGGPKRNDFYEPRKTGSFFTDKGRVGMNVWWESNFAKKLSWYGSVFGGTGSVFKRRTLELSLGGKVRFSSKFSVDLGTYLSDVTNQAGFAGFDTTASGAPSIIFSRRDLNTVENTLNLKYNFTNRMGLTLRARHYWSKVNPRQFFELDLNGKLQSPTVAFEKNVKQNYNYMSVDMVYTWQFAQGSFLTVVWKDIAETFNREFENNYTKNLGNTISGDQFNSLSLRVIYFIDYLTVRRKMKKK
ncbi:MAG: carbohydrate binding family 9 domain-containing protein [Ferruginibacter sp.]|nr:carbohydrate binding family 9 domain-containing protein [Ferruginibacter sp.]